MQRNLKIYESIKVTIRHTQDEQKLSWKVFKENVFTINTHGFQNKQFSILLLSLYLMLTLKTKLKITIKKQL